MKVLKFFAVLMVLIQVSCGPTTSGVRSNSPTINKVWNSVPSYIKRMKPKTAFHSYAKHAKAHDIRQFILSNADEMPTGPYFRIGVDAAVERNDFEVIKVIFDSMKSNKDVEATAALGKIKSKRVLDFLLSQGAKLNGIPYDMQKHIDNLDTTRLLASQSVFLHMGAESDVAQAKLLVEAGADPFAAQHGMTAIKQLEIQAKSFAKHEILIPRARKMERIAAYLKTVGKLTDVEVLVVAGKLKELKTKLNAGNINLINMQGNTLLHLAAKENKFDIVKYLVNRKSGLMRVKNKSNKTPLDLIRLSKSGSAKYISCKQNKFCKSVTSFESYIKQNCSSQNNINKCVVAINKDIHGVFRPTDMTERVAKHDYNKSCGKFSYKRCTNFIKRYANTDYAVSAQETLDKFSKTKGMKIFNNRCGVAGNIKKCKSINVSYPGMIATTKINQSLAFLSQKCRLKENGWIYKSSQCLSGLAHGVGEAENVEKKLSYKGKFTKGQRLKGKVFYNGKPMFDGTLSKGKPNGAGVCFFQNEPEKCEFYEGKRVDVLYKQRIANARQEKKMDEKLAEMKRMQQQQNDRISQMQGRINSAPPSQQGGDSSVGQQIGDYALKKAGEKVMDSIFDKLF